MKRDYIVYAPPYSKSAGIRVMHLLAHHLNERGYSAFIPTLQINPELNNLMIKTKDEMFRLLSIWKKEEPIVVYPEIVSSNPTGYKRVVRYILNKPGFLGGDGKYAEGDMIFAYNKYCQSFFTPQTPILEIPTQELDKFHPPDKSIRSGGVYFVYKGQDNPKVKDTEIMREITHDWPATPKELAELLQTSDIFYTYDNNTALHIGSRLCGCPTVIIPEKALNLTKDDPIFMSKNGLAWGTAPEEIQFARDTVHLFYQDYLNHIKNWEKQLETFINITQAIKICIS